MSEAFYSSTKRRSRDQTKSSRKGTQREGLKSSAAPRQFNSGLRPPRPLRPLRDAKAVFARLLTYCCQESIIQSSSLVPRADERKLVPTN